MSKIQHNSTFASLVQRFFVERLMQQRNASPKTIATYRDAFRLLLDFAAQHLKQPHTQFSLRDLTGEFVLGFLNHLETDRDNSIRTRNARLAVIRSFVRYVGLQEPSTLATVQSILAIPMKRFERPLLGFLQREHIQAVLQAPDANTWAGRRDRVMFATLYNTGARASELIGLRIGDVVLTSSPAVRIHGKGRKDRSVPLWRNTAAQLREWVRRYAGNESSPLFPNRSGTALSRSALTDRLALAVSHAAEQYPQLRRQHISPHTIRHSTAMHLLQSGVDITVIALWLGHESPATTHFYIEADLSMKEKALGRLEAPHLTMKRFRPPEQLLSFLQSL